MTLTVPEKREFDVVGQRVQRPDGYEKVTGVGKYVADLALPGMLTGRILRSPLPHARIVRIDTSRARKVPGVRTVVTAEDTPKRSWGAFVQDQPILAMTGKVETVLESERTRLEKEPGHRRVLFRLTFHKRIPPPPEAFLRHVRRTLW